MEMCSIRYYYFYLTPPPAKSTRGWSRALGTDLRAFALQLCALFCTDGKERGGWPGQQMGALSPYYTVGPCWMCALTALNAGDGLQPRPHCPARTQLLTSHVSEPFPRTTLGFALMFSRAGLRVSLPACPPRATSG